MHSSSISTYVRPISVFGLHGCADSNETGGVPCRVRVGPRRFLDITVWKTGIFIIKTISGLLAI